MSAPYPEPNNTDWYETLRTFIAAQTDLPVFTSDDELVEVSHPLLTQHWSKYLYNDLVLDPDEAPLSAEDFYEEFGDLPTFYFYLDRPRGRTLCCAWIALVRNPGGGMPYVYLPLWREAADDEYATQALRDREYVDMGDEMTIYSDPFIQGIYTRVRYVRDGDTEESYSGRINNYWDWLAAHKADYEEPEGLQIQIDGVQAIYGDLTPSLETGWHHLSNYLASNRFWLSQVSDDVQGLTSQINALPVIIQHYNSEPYPGPADVGELVPMDAFHNHYITVLSGQQLHIEWVDPGYYDMEPGSTRTIVIGGLTPQGKVTINGVYLQQDTPAKITLFLTLDEYGELQWVADFGGKIGWFKLEPPSPVFDQAARTVTIPDDPNYVYYDSSVGYQDGQYAPGTYDSTTMPSIAAENGGRVDLEVVASDAYRISLGRTHWIHKTGPFSHGFDDTLEE